MIDSQSTVVTRTSDADNRLQTAYNSGVTTTYTYDDNGNLVHILPAGGVGARRYGYNQRNLLITGTHAISGSGYLPLASYLYDGANHRLQQVIYSDTVPLTTTYTNDIQGLSQVLLADDGTTQTANLFGLDLIQQDDGNTTRTLLADGLGSVRTEMVGGNVETVTTYDPYGTLLTQTGTSGTAYGYTGEQHDMATGPLYLRARYYNPYLNQFQSRDPFPGYAKLPQSQNGYSYVNNNPINRTDPSGLCEQYLPDEACWSVYEEIARRYPSALNNPYIPLHHGYWDKQLHELPWFALEGVLRNLDMGYGYPSYWPDNWDGVAVYGSIKVAEGWFTNQAGVELLYNFESADLTLFAVIGFGGGGGAAATVDGTIVLVFNIGNNNLNYSGDFVSGALGASFGLGGSVQYSLTPADIEAGRFLNPQEAYSVGLGIMQIYDPVGEVRKVQAPETAKFG